MALIHAPGETLADALNGIGKITGARQIADTTGTGVLVIRRPDQTVVAAFHDTELEADTIRDEAL